MERLKWCLKQFFPFVYVTTFSESGKRRLCIWRMWAGRCFNARYFDLAS